MEDWITVETDLFEHKQVKPHFINPCRFGEDFCHLAEEGSVAPYERWLHVL